jgi:hypothetical protein
MNSIVAVRWFATMLPGPLAMGAILTPIQGYTLQEYVAVALFFAIFLGGLLLRSDSLHITSFAGLAALLVLGISQAGYLYAFAAVVALLVALDFVGLGHSLFGLTRWKADLSADGASSKYLDIVTEHAFRSSMVGISTFLVSAATMSVPLPQLEFGNPVSSTGILALVVLLLILLALSSSAQIRRWFRGRQGNSTLER